MCVCVSVCVSVCVCVCVCLSVCVSVCGHMCADDRLFSILRHHNFLREMEGIAVSGELHTLYGALR